VGYEFHLVFFWLRSADLAVDRVAERVRQGGPDIPEPIIRTRYKAGLVNLVHLYLPLADTWRILDNSITGKSRRISSGDKSGIIRIEDIPVWESIRGGSNDE
jgi:predicted ABC-type ATPase